MFFAFDAHRIKPHFQKGSAFEVAHRLGGNHGSVRVRAVTNHGLSVHDDWLRHGGREPLPGLACLGTERLSQPHSNYRSCGNDRGFRLSRLGFALATCTFGAFIARCASGAVVWVSLRCIGFLASEDKTQHQQEQNTDVTPRFHSYLLVPENSLPNRPSRQTSEAIDNLVSFRPVRGWSPACHSAHASLPYNFPHGHSAALAWRAREI